MKSDFTLRSPARIVFGAGTFDKLGAETAALAPEGTVLAVVDPAVREMIAGRLEREILAGRRLAWHVITGGEPTIEAVDRAAGEARETEPSIVIGIGGGSAMDTAKALAALATHPGGTEQYRGLDKLTRAALPKIMVPTTAGTGSEVTPTAVFIGGGRKGGINSHRIIPETALLDPELTLSLPLEVTVSTGLDALAHALESLLSLNSNPYTEPLSLQAIALVAGHLPSLVEKGRDIEARGRMLSANLLAGLTLANAGVIASHSLSYPLGPRYGVSHGIANGILLPLVVEKIGDAAGEKLARAADALGLGEGEKPARKAGLAVDFFRSFPARLGFERRLRDFGVEKDPELFDAMAGEALEVAVPIANTPGGMTRQDLAGIYARAW